MWRGEHKLAIQVGPIGHYGKVVLEAEQVDGNGTVSVDFAPAISDQWKSGARFGIAYALDHVDTRMHFPNGGRVRVLTIHGMPCDTNNVVIAYVSANAMYKALGIEPTKKPAFDKETGLFTFPK